MALFKRKKKETEQEKKTDTKKEMDEALKDDISKAYDELISGGRSYSEETPENNDETAAAVNAPSEGDFEAELLKTKINAFKVQKNREALFDILKMLPGRNFFLPALSNVQDPLARKDGEVKLKEGVVLNPALLQSKDGKTFLPIFTDRASIKQKSPSGIVMQFKFEQCVSILYNKNNPVFAIVINPFTENFIMGEELLRPVFKEIKKEG